MQQFIKTTLNPAHFHGHDKSPPFFEGWYFKLVTASESHRLAIIPGIFLGENGHTFVQVLDGNSAQSRYHRFDLADFWASRTDFEIEIGPNYFSQTEITLEIEDALGQISGSLSFEGLSPWPVSLISPGIMGWYAWVPKMECYHGVLSLDHTIQGALTIDGVLIDFSGGRGYIEKDWGQSFPEAYIWFQGNHFETPGTSLTASVAIIPWLKNAFRGFIIGFWHDQVLHRFATYNGAKIEHLSVTDQQVTWVVRNRAYRLEMTVSRTAGGRLHEPTRAKMLQRVEESMTATVEIRLTTLPGAVIFHEIGRNVGLEVQGDIARLLTLK